MATAPVHAAPGVLDRPDVGSTKGGGGWAVTVYDNDVNTVEQVMAILVEATGCDEQEAAIETWEIDRLGRSTVHHGGQETCERAAAVIRRIGIKVTVDEE